MRFHQISSRFWWIIGWLVSQSGGLAGIVLNWESTPAYLLWSAVSIGLVALIAVLLWFLPHNEGWQHFAGRWTFRWMWILPAFGAGLLMWALPLEPAYPLDALRWALTVVAAGVMAVRLRGVFPCAWRRWGFLALLALMLLFSLATARTYPRIYTDEGWYLNKAWSSASQGPLYAASIHLDVLGSPQRIDAPFEYWPIGLWLRVVGLGLWQGRLTMWLFMPLAAALIFRAGYLLFNNPQAGILAALLMTASVPVLNTSHFFRPEIVLVAILALALYLHALAEKRGRFLEPFILGLLLSLSMSIHTNSAVFCLAFGGLYLARTISSCWQNRRLQLDARLLGLAVGGITGAAIFAVIYILPDINTFSEQMKYSYRLNYDTAQVTILQTVQGRVVTTVSRLRSWFAFSLVEASAVMLAVAAALIWGERTLRSLVMLLALCLVGFFILGGREAPTYIAILAPLGILLVAGTCVQLLHKPHHLFAIGALLIAATWGVSIRQAAIAQKEGYNRQYEQCLTAIDKWLPEKGMILGEHLFWLARPEPTGYAARTLVETPWPGRDTEGWWEWIDPDIVLWPGPIYGAHYQYVNSHGYTYHELPECPPAWLTIWLKPGINLN